MNKINANQFPITLGAEVEGVRGAFRSNDIKRFIKAIPVINEKIEEGVITVTENKELRGRINDFVSAAFNLTILENFFYAGKYESIPEELSDINYEYPREARLLASFEKKLNKFKLQDHAVVVQSRALVEELKPLADVVAFFKSVEVKTSAKRATEKAKAAEEVRIKNDTDVLYQTVLPLKLIAQDKAEEHFRISVRAACKLIIKHEGNLETLVPVPDELKYDSHEYQALALARSFYLSICDNNNGTLTPNADKINDEVYRTRQGAGFQFDAFVYKLNEKINDVTVSAELSGDPWNGSTLVVETANKGRQVWQTKIIVNVSKLGKLFNQWPTRKVS